ncbi:hypothetical protein E2C01_016433 [Portunus trituberculatus]|uniref:Uncharacterized protein n=1 Tax=Portunus trituberculatus TaxID=210409 RepID=A0A5B7DQK0_PORTR|nr:hypothetical protein [Portunus trituberculatus]
MTAKLCGEKRSLLSSMNHSTRTPSFHRYFYHVHRYIPFAHHHHHIPSAATTTVTIITTITNGVTSLPATITIDTIPLPLDPRCAVPPNDKLSHFPRPYSGMLIRGVKEGGERVKSKSIRRLVPVLVPAPPLTHLAPPRPSSGGPSTPSAPVYSGSSFHHSSPPLPSFSLRAPHLANQPAILPFPSQASRAIAYTPSTK